MKLAISISLLATTCAAILGVVAYMTVILPDEHGKACRAAFDENYYVAGCGEVLDIDPDRAQAFDIIARAKGGAVSFEE